MANSTEKNEYLTTIVCIMVAIAILAAGVTARQGDSPASEPAQWESDVRYQIKSSFRNNARERDARLSQVQAVMSAWKASKQNEADRETLINWLSVTIVRSMAGSIDELPPPPKFSSSDSGGHAGSQSAGLPPLPTTTLQAPNLLTGARMADAPITPTPYDPFSPDDAKNPGNDGKPADATFQEDDVALVQPPSVDPTKRHLLHKPTIETAALLSAPLPGSTSVKLETSAKTIGSDIPPLADPEHIEPVTINLTELTARITGYNHGLDEVETALLRADKTSLSLVAEQAELLDAMTRDYQFVRLYYESLTEKERKTLPAPRPLSATLREVIRQLDRYEKSLDSDFLGSIDTAQAEQIKELRELLAAIGERIEDQVYHSPQKLTSLNDTLEKRDHAE